MSAVIEQTEILIDEWIGCYRGGWKGVIVDEAFSHPAKVAFNLARRIYDHAIEERWIASGDTIVDPFGGIGGCAFHGLMNGMIVVTNELEEKFVNLSKQNRELWRKQYTGLPGFDADNWIILQGDSRKLASVISEAGYCVSSPPYAGSINQNDQANDHAARANRKAAAGVDMTRSHNRGGPNSVLNRDQKYGDEPGQLGAMREGSLDCVISSPPYAEMLAKDRGENKRFASLPDSVKSKLSKADMAERQYGDAEGQLGAMREGDLSLAVSSPPFPQPYTGGGGINVKGYGDGSDKVGSRTYQSLGGDRAEGNLETLKDGGFDVAISSPPYNPPMSQDHNGSRGGKRGTDPSETGAFVKYGNSEGQIEGLSMEGFDVAISSPPYEGYDDHGGRATAAERDRRRLERLRPDLAGRFDTCFKGSEEYGTTEGQLGAERSDTFWSASRTILEQLYSILTPGAHAIFIVKAFVRNKQIVDFPGQWAQLCEAVGFKLIHDHHAMLGEDYGTQGGMFGQDKEYKVKRVSFFRRLHERKSPETEIHYENVLCFER